MNRAALQLIAFMLLLYTCASTLPLNQSIQRWRLIYPTPKPFCSANLIQDSNKFQIISQEFSTWLKTDTKHLIKAIILACNRHFDDLMSIFHQVCAQILLNARPFIIGLGLLLVLSVYWITHLHHQSKMKDQHIVYGNQFSNNTQISLAILLFSLLITISICIYGISGSQKIQKTFNLLFCIFFDQDHGYIRDGNGTVHGGLTQFASEIQQFIGFFTQKYANIEKIITNEVSQVNELGNSLLNKITINQTQSQFFQQISSVTTIFSNITTTLMGLQQSMIDFNDTLEYERQVIIGQKYLLSSVDKYGSRYIGYDNIGKFFSYGTIYVLLAVIFLCLFVLIKMGSIIIKQQNGQIYFRQILQYLLAITCMICLLIACFNCIFITSLYSVRGCGDYMISNMTLPKQQFKTSNFINGILIEIMIQFWPNYPGNMSAYYDGMLLSNLARLQYDIGQLNEERVVNLQEKGLELYKGTVLSDKFTLYFEQLLHQTKKFGTALDSIKKIRFEMISPEGRLGRLDPRGIGKNIYKYLSILSQNIVIRAYEYRLIFGYAGLFLMISLISLHFVAFDYKHYVRANDEHGHKLEHFQGNESHSPDGRQDKIPHVRKGSSEDFESDPLHHGE